MGERAKGGAPQLGSRPTLPPANPPPPPPFLHPATQRAIKMLTFPSGLTPRRLIPYIYSLLQPPTFLSFFFLPVPTSPLKMLLPYATILLILLTVTDALPLPDSSTAASQERPRSPRRRLLSSTLRAGVLPRSGPVSPSHNHLERLVSLPTSIEPQGIEPRALDARAAQRFDGEDDLTADDGGDGSTVDDGGDGGDDGGDEDDPAADDDPSADDPSSDDPSSDEPSSDDPSSDDSPADANPTADLTDDSSAPATGNDTPLSR